MSLNKMWNRRQCTKFNGVPYVIQRAAEAVFSDEGIKEAKAMTDAYMQNARIISGTMEELAYAIQAASTLRTYGLNAHSA